MSRSVPFIFLLLGIGPCVAAGRVADAAVLAQSTLHLRKAQAEQFPYYPQPVPQQVPYYSPPPQQPVPQNPFYAPLPGQPMPGYAPQQGPYMAPPQQAPYYPGAAPQVPYYPGQPQQAPFVPGQPLPAPYYPVQQPAGAPLQPPQMQPQPPQFQPQPQLQQPQPPLQQPQAQPPLQQPQAQPQAQPLPQLQPGQAQSQLSVASQAQQENARYEEMVHQFADLQHAQQQHAQNAVWQSVYMEPVVPTLHDTVEVNHVHKTSFEKHPKLYNTHRIVPSTKTHCFQGQKDYMAVALERLKNSPLAMQYENTTLEEGSCSESTFNKGPDYHKCFPKASLYHPFAQSRQQVMLKEISATLFGNTEEKRVAVQKSWKAYTKEQTREDIRQSELEVQALCDNGRMLEETFGLPIAAASFSMKPASGAYCLQGAKTYLKTVLGQLNGTDEFRDTEVEEGACLLHDFGTGPREPRCLPHASLYFSDGGRAEERFASAEEQLSAVCENATMAENVSAALQARQDRANLRARRLKADADELAESNYYMFDEKLYACWQGPKYRLENVKDSLRDYGMPEWFFEQRMKIYMGTCDNMCMVNGWVERRSCIRHVRQCRHPDVEEIDRFLKKRETLVPIIKNGTMAKVTEMIDNTDLEISCGPQTVLTRKKKKKTSMWDAIDKQIHDALNPSMPGVN